MRNGRSRRNCTNNGVLTAPNLQYFMDSPIEFGPIALREFGVGGSRFRFAMHHTGTDAELDGLVKDVEKIVQQQGAIYGEYPTYEPGYYTFLADYLPYANGDGMEHRNSTVISAPARLRTTARGFSTPSRTSSFTAGTSSASGRRGSSRSISSARTFPGELWLAEGFTQYYGPLTLQRAGLVDLAVDRADADRPG